MAERPEDFNLPVSVVARILKESLPENVTVSKEARAALAKAASIFVLYSTSLSNNFANKSKCFQLSLFTIPDFRLLISRSIFDCEQ